MPRPRKLEREEALEAALGVFWRKGYEGTSYSDLVAATGAERPALYAAFGNKEALFRAALERYGTHYGHYVWDAMECETALDVAEKVLIGAAELATRFTDRAGCFGINGALAGSDEAEPARNALVEWRASGETALRDRFDRARQQGDLPADADCAVLAAYVLAVTHGIAVQAKAGHSKELLLGVARQALASFPREAK